MSTMDVRTMKTVRREVRKQQRQAYASNAGQASKDPVDGALQCVVEWLDGRVAEHRPPPVWFNAKTGKTQKSRPE